MQDGSLHSLTFLKIFVDLRSAHLVTDVFISLCDEVMCKENQDIDLFLSFCIEHYKRAKGMSGEVTLKLFSQYGVLEYLKDCYDVLHTQGYQWLVTEIDNFINRRRGGK